jgi:hypothetical protein
MKPFRFPDLIVEILRLIEDGPARSTTLADQLRLIDTEQASRRLTEPDDVWGLR